MNKGCDCSLAHFKKRKIISLHFLIPTTDNSTNSKQKYKEIKLSSIADCLDYWQTKENTVFLHEQCLCYSFTCFSLNKNKVTFHKSSYVSLKKQTKVKWETPKENIAVVE